MHALLPMVSDIKWATLPEPGEIHAMARWPAVLRSVDPGLHRDLLHEVTQEARRLAGGWEHSCPPGLPVSPLPPAAGGPPPSPTPPPPPPRLSGRAPRAGDLRGPPDHGAADPGSVIDLQARFAAPLVPLFAPSDIWWWSTWVGWVLPAVSPPAGAAEAPPFPPSRWGATGPSPPLLLLRSPHPWPMRVAQANVTSLRLHWHTGRRVARGCGADLRN